MKTKCGDCNNCPLITSKKFASNSIISNNNNVGDVDIMIVCDYDKDGESIVKYLKDTHPDMKYCIMNKYLCDSSGFNNVDSATDCCKGNCQAVADKCKAKNRYILDLKYKGSNNPLSSFDKLQSVDDLKTVLEKKDAEIKAEQEKKHYYSFQIPSKYYTADYRLVDVQYIQNSNRLIYIFRDKDNKKEFYEYPMYDKNHYWYESINSNKIIEKIDNLKLVTGQYKDRNRTIRCYGGDVNITTQHSVDYFLNSKAEAPIIKHNVMFFDIETYQYLKGTFPNPAKAEYPITAISFRTDTPADYTHVFLLKLDGHIDSKVDELMKTGNYQYITVFKDEALMIRTFFDRIRKASIDFLAGWNVSGFDIPYIVKRMSNLGIKPEEFSPFGNCFADSKSGKNIITGYVVMDQLKLFKELTYQTQPSYSLNAIAGVVLGKEKVQHIGKSIDDMYHNDIKLFMDYSQQDTNLIYEIDDEVKHIALQDEIRRVATVSHEGANSTIGQATGLYVTELKKNGLIARNYTHDVEKESFPGAYVYDSPGGLFEGLLCDFDFTSLYPSIIRTFNVGNDSYIAKIDDSIARAYVFDRKSLIGKKFDIKIDPIHNHKIVKIDFVSFEKFIKKYNAYVSIVGTIFCSHKIHSSINCDMLAMLMNSRKVYKNKMLEAKEAGNVQQTVEYNNKQLAFKILANSLYGVLGNEHWAFYCPDLGKTITLTGQEMLKYSATRVFDYMTGKIDENNHPIDIAFEPKAVVNDIVKYGDTDSIFVNLTDYLNKRNIPLTNNPDSQNAIAKVQSFINKIALPQLLQIHNVDLDHSVMNLKNEFLFSKYYTLKGSKHYCSKVIAQEGKKVEFIDVKGLEVKRSEIPPLSQQMLQTMIDTIMDENNKKCDLKPLLENIAAKYKKEAINILTQHKIGAARIVAFSKELKDYKTIPQHIKGMLMWNELMGKEDFKTGTKGKLWNITGIELEQAPKELQDRYHDKFLKKFSATDLKYICTPEDLESLPSYFNIDMPKMLSYAIDDRADALLEPLWVEDDSDLLF